MIELFTFPTKFDGWPEKTDCGTCKVLLHRLSDEPRIVHSWLKCFFIFDKKLSIQIEKISSLPNGIYQVLSILFFEKNEDRHFLAVTNPFNFKITEILLSDGEISEAPHKLVKVAIDRWELSVAIGNKKDLKDIQHAEAHIICTDCLITVPVRLGPAELYPLSKSGIVDLSSSIKEAMLFQGIRDVPFHDIAESIIKQEDRISPLFCMSFRRIYRDDKEFMLPLLPYIKRVFGILCINRGSYSRMLGGIYLKQKDGYKDVFYMNLNSYYRGNLLGGSLSKEKPIEWNRQYTQSLSSSFKTEIMNKLNSAHAETDLDISYFRLWSIIEAISKVIFGNKNLKTIKKLIKKAYEPQDAENIVKLSLGNCHFSLDDLLQMWHDWRNCTAHEGGIYSYYSGLRKIHPRIKDMIDEMTKLEMPVEFGEDRCLMLLRDVCTKIVENYITDKIKSVQK